MIGFTSLAQMVGTLRARWRLAAVIAAAVTVVLLGITALLPAKYSAEADIIFNSRTNDAIVDRGDGTTFNAYMTAEVELLSSRRVLARLATDPAFLNHPSVKALIAAKGWRSAALTDRLVKTIDAALTIVNDKNSRTVTVTAIAGDPDLAALIANGVSRSYLATNLDLRVAPARTNVAFYRQQKATRRSELTAASARLDAFLHATGMTGREIASGADDTQLRVLAQERTTSQAQLAQSSAEVAVGDVASGVAAGNIVNPVVQRLRSDIADQTAALADLTVLRGPNYPSVAQARERLAELRQQLARENSTIADGLRRRNASASLAERRMGALEAGKRADLSTSAGQRSMLAALSGEVDRAKANYDAVTARLAEVELASSLEAPNAAVLSAALPPLTPSFPSWPLAIVVALLAGIVAGILAALLAELRHPLLRSWRDAEAALGGAPVLCDMAA